MIFLTFIGLRIKLRLGEHGSKPPRSLDYQEGFSLRYKEEKKLDSFIKKLLASLTAYQNLAN